MRHLAFEVDDLEVAIHWLTSCGIKVDEVRRDEMTQKPFTFIADPDALPIEFYEK